MHAFRNFFTKKSKDKQIFIWWYETISLVFFLPIFLYFFYRNDISGPFYWIVAFSAGLIHFLYWIFLSKSYDHGDLSHVYPIMRSSPALVLLFSVMFLNEQVSILGVVGILTVAVGVYIINMKSFSFHEISAPIKTILSERHTQFAFLTLLSVAAYSIVDKIGVTYVHPVLHIYFLSIFGFVLLTLYITKTKSRKDIVDEWVSNKRDIIVSGILGISGYALILAAFKMDKVSYVVGLRQLSIVFAVLLGGHILKEKCKAVRLTASCLIFIGAFLITIAR